MPSREHKRGPEAGQSALGMRVVTAELGARPPEATHRSVLKGDGARDGEACGEEICRGRDEEMPKKCVRGSQRQRCYRSGHTSIHPTRRVPPPGAWLFSVSLDSLGLLRTSPSLTPSRKFPFPAVNRALKY